MGPSQRSSRARRAGLAALALSAAGALASSLRLFGRRRLPLFLAGAAAGLAVLWLK